MTNQKIIDYLKVLPSEWRDQLTKLLCEINSEKNIPSCDIVKDCETVTSLSTFTVNGTEVSVVYKDERGVSFTRSFDLASVVNSVFDGLEPDCLTDETTWSNMTLSERIQLLINQHCDCCE